MQTATYNGNNLEFRYNADGIRTRKIVNGAYTYYSVNGNNVVWQRTPNGIDAFFDYDAAGRAATMAYNGSTYYYVYNMQGDVIGLVDRNGDKMVEYTYDPYGKQLTCTGSLASTIGQINPFRYRGYVYDAETGLYYVSSRYYDPETCRFINADSQLNGNSILGYNLFAYCENNPVNKSDPTGHFGIGTLIGGIVGGVIGGLSGALTAAVKGKSILAGAVTGAATGAAIGIICGVAADAVATGGASVLVDAALLCGSVAAIGNLANQALNYSIEKKQQPKTNKSNKTNKSQGNSKAVSVTGKPASECDSFAEYVDLKSIAVSGVAAAAFAPLGIGANYVVNSAFVGLESGASNIAGQVIANFAMGGNVSILQGIIDLF